MAQATATRTRRVQRNRVTTPQLHGGQLIGEYQQISGNARWSIDNKGMLSLLYQPFTFGTFGQWQEVPLDPIVQFAVYSLAQDCGKLPAALGGAITTDSTDGATTTMTAQRKATQAAAVARRARAQNKVVDRSGD